MLPQKIYSPEEIYSKIVNDKIPLAEAERLISRYANHQAIKAMQKICQKTGCSISKEIEEGILRMSQKLDELIEKTLGTLSIAKEAKKI